MKLILGSKSPRRKEILSMVNSEFEVRVSDCDESYGENTPLCQVPQILAERKARAIEAKENEIVIGCDTVVIYDGELMGKPCDKADAVRMLEKLSGTTHHVVSGICVKQGMREYSEAVVTDVTFRPLTKNEISAYVEKYNPVDKAGAYGIQEAAGAFVKEIRGDFYNVVGLPLCRLCEILKNEFNYEIV